MAASIAAERAYELSALKVAGLTVGLPQKASACLVSACGSPLTFTLAGSRARFAPMISAVRLKRADHVSVLSQRVASQPPTLGG